MRELIEIDDTDGTRLVLEIGTKTVETHSRLTLRPEAWRGIIDGIRSALEKSKHLRTAD